MAYDSVWKIIPSTSSHQRDFTKTCTIPHFQLRYVIWHWSLFVYTRTFFLRPMPLTYAKLITYRGSFLFHFFSPAVGCWHIWLDQHGKVPDPERLVNLDRWHDWRRVLGNYWYNVVQTGQYYPRNRPNHPSLSESGNLPWWPKHICQQLC